MFFDDFAVTHIKSQVIQTNDYYPFGLTFNSYRKENATPNRWKFQGQEHIDDLGLNWDSFKWRNHQPDIGRFFNVDPLAEKFYYNSPYAFSENKVTTHVELEGAEALGIGLLNEIAEFKSRTSSSVLKMKAAGGRLGSSNSGKVPEEAPMSDEDRQMVKLGSVLSDAEAIKDGAKDVTKTGVRMGAEEMQSGGEAIETAGILTGQPEISALGRGISLAGKGIEMTMDAAEGDLKTEDVIYEGTKQIIFGGMSKGAERAAKAGNLDEQANNIFQAVVKGWEMLTDWGKGVVDEDSKQE